MGRTSYYIVEWEYVCDHTNTESIIFCMEDYEKQTKSSVIRRANEALMKVIGEDQINFSERPTLLLKVLKQSDKERTAKDGRRIISRVLILKIIKRYTEAEQEWFNNRKNEPPKGLFPKV